MRNILLESNRWKHLAGGFVLGILCPTAYTAMLVGATAGGSLEFKDTQHAHSRTAWDWLDFAATLAGTLLGYALRAAVTG